MEENLSEEILPYPIQSTILGIPQEHDLLLTYGVYKPSNETRKLNTEQGRNIFADAFIEDVKLGPLSDLSIRAMALAYNGKDILSIVDGDPVKRRIFYDSLSVDLPLEQCYHIADDRYWRRVVLAKTDNKSLIFEKNYNWKSLGTSIKYVELVEACPVEYWPEEEMYTHAMRIKAYVKEMHIRRLQTQLDRTFQQYFLSESDLSDSDESDSTDVLSLSPEEEEEQQEEEGEGDGEGERLDEEMSVSGKSEIIKTEEELEMERIMQRDAIRKREANRDRREKQRALKEAQIKRREKREYFRKRREAKKPPPPPPPPPPTKGRRKRKPKPKGIFDIEVEPEEPEEDLDIVDKRNMEKVLRQRKKEIYFPEFCHHVDLRFIRFFEYMETFTIEFQGPKLNREYNTKHFFFSYTDIENLAFGLDFLRMLKIFRLRNSRMDATKLMTLARSLKNLEYLEIVDFGFDQLTDNCGTALRTLFRNNDSIKSLELEGNLIGRESLASLGEALANYDGVLEYLGLASNMLQNDELHEFNQHIIGTNHVHNLNIRGSFLSQEAIKCCIADELLRKHTVLKHLALTALEMDEETATAVINALETNKVILDFDCRGCNLPLDIDRDITVLLERNRYIAKNPYLGDENKTEQDINEYVNRVKNPILINAYAAIKERAECLINQPDVTRRSIAQSIYEFQTDSSDDNTSVVSLPSKYSLAISKINFTLADNTPFFYEPNNFDEKQFRAHINLPGPGERYYYFLENKRSDLPKD